MRKRYCPQGHDTYKTGRTKSRHCILCKVERLEKYVNDLSEVQKEQRRENSRLRSLRLRRDPITNMKRNANKRISRLEKRLKDGK